MRLRVCTTRANAQNTVGHQTTPNHAAQGWLTRRSRPALGRRARCIARCTLLLPAASARLPRAAQPSRGRYHLLREGIVGCRRTDKQRCAWVWLLRTSSQCLATQLHAGPCHGDVREPRRSSRRWHQRMAPCANASLATLTNMMSAAQAPLFTSQVRRTARSTGSRCSGKSVHGS